ncbi:MAG TPA: DNA recombination protein RmuC, partial [Lapillicoccus sp.]|nr:DNA recombination protein RmuC [Lapillicoccus sp.]
RLGSLGTHAQTMGAALRRSVESYNAFVGSLEHRVLPTARRMRELGVVERDLDHLGPLEASPRPLTAYELVGDRHTVESAAVDEEVTRPELDLDEPGQDQRARGA